MPGPLSGFKILDLSRVLSGPVATVLLADQGADVLQVEPLGGDIVRHMGGGATGISPGFLSANRGKRSVALDLKTEAGINSAGICSPINQFVSIAIASDQVSRNNKDLTTVNRTNKKAGSMSRLFRTT